MAEVTDVTVKKRILMELGIPFFMLTGFVIAAIVFGTLYFANQLKSEGGEDPQTLVENVDRVLESFLLENTKNFDGAASMLSSGTPLAEEDNELRQILSKNSNILALSFFNTEGDQIYELHKSRVGSGLLDTLWRGNTYVALTKSSGGAVFNVLTNDSGNYIIVAIPRETEGGNFNGALVFGLDATSIVRTLTTLSENTTLYVAVVEGRTASTLISANSLPLEAVAKRPSPDRLRVLFENNKQEYGYEFVDGTKVAGSWDAVGNTGWFVLAESFSAELPAGVGRLYVIAALVLIVFVVLVFVYLNAVNRKLVLPLRKIEKTMNYFKTGDYSEPVKIDVKNEFIAIADQLNKMSKHIENNTSERVSQLKKVLERQNTDTRLLIEKDVELREQGQKLKELDQAKSMFVSVAAHQMRTPLAAIKWAIKLVMDGDVGPVNAEQKEYLGKGYESTSRMINLINDLLDVDKIESDKFSYAFKVEQLEVILQGIVDDLTPISNEKGVNLVFQKNNKTYPSISADQVKLRNALQNLVDNAIKYTIGGGDVTVKLGLDGADLKLSISDTGIGIPMSEQSKVFGKFFRAKNAVRQETDGSGLGLFIVKKIIEKHNGEVHFESKEGKGTTFFITIPSKDGGGVPLTDTSAPAESKKEEAPKATEDSKTEEEYVQNEANSPNSPANDALDKSEENPQK